MAEGRRHRVALVHWKDAEVPERVRRLEAAGYAVDAGAVTPARLRSLRGDTPDAVVIDLGRLPSHGRDVAFQLRTSRATRRVPLVFVGGDAEKRARLRKALPDAVYTTWPRIRGAVAGAIQRPPQDPVVPSSVLAGYSGTPLVKKLGIKSDSILALLGAPEGFEGVLGELPAGVTLRRSARGHADLTLWFVQRARDLGRRMEAMAARDGVLWIAWPKQASDLPTDVTQTAVRRTGLDAGLVDSKICAIDGIWSGLRFTRRR